jgi:hypothetical protein
MRQILPNKRRNYFPLNHSEKNSFLSEKKTVYSVKQGHTARDKLRKEDPCFVLKLYSKSNWYSQMRTPVDWGHKSLVENNENPFSGNIRK